MATTTAADMMSTQQDISEMENPAGEEFFEKRLRKARQSIEKALQQQNTTHTQPSSSSAEPTYTTTTSTIDGKRSFELGLALFGSGGGGALSCSSLPFAVEEERLKCLEEDLQQLMHKRSLEAKLEACSLDEEEEEENISENLPSMDDSSKKTQVEEEAAAPVVISAVLQRHLDFVQKCRQAMGLASQAEGCVYTHQRDCRHKERSKHSSSNSKTGSPPLVQAAQLIRRADQACTEAYTMLHQLLDSSSSSSKDHDWEKRAAVEAASSTHQASDTPLPSTMIRAEGPQTLRTTRNQIRAIHVRIASSAKDLWASLVEVSASSITIATSTSTCTADQDEASEEQQPQQPNEELVLAYDTLLALAQPQDQVVVHSHAQHQQQQPMTDLEEVLHLLAQHLHQRAIQPLLQKTLTPTTSPQDIQFTQQVTQPTSTKQQPQVVLSWNTVEKDDTGSKKRQLNKMQGWCQALQLVEKIVKFVQQHALLGGGGSLPDKGLGLCRKFGFYLLGNGHGNDEEEDSLELDSQHLEVHESLAQKWTNMSTTTSTPKTGGGQLLQELHQALWDVIPSTFEELQSIATPLDQATTRFEQHMVDLNLLLPSQNNDDAKDKNKTMGPLSTTTKEIAIRYAEKRRMTVLDQGRGILMQDYYNTLQVGGGTTPHEEANSGVTIHQVTVYDRMEDSPAMAMFQLPTMAISVVASRLLELCRGTMEEAVASHANTAKTSSSRVLAPMLYRTARELLDLYRAMIPSLHGHEVSTVPRCAAVFHNDCVFLAHHLSTLGFRYRDGFANKSENDTGGGRIKGEEEDRHCTPPAKKEGQEGEEGEMTNPLCTICTFVDMVPAFRELAQRCLGNMVERHKMEVADLVRDGGILGGKLQHSLRKNEGDATWSDAEGAVRAAHFHLEQLSHAWRPILARDVYCRAMGNLVDTLFTLVLDPVLQAEDVSESASRFVASLHHGALQSSIALFEPNQAEGNATPGGGSSSSSAQPAQTVAKHSCTTWDRFEVVGQFMNMSLSEINQGLASGVFRSVTAAELSHLIMATFDDSEKRRQLLYSLQASEDGQGGL